MSGITYRFRAFFKITFRLCPMSEISRNRTIANNLFRRRDTQVMELKQNPTVKQRLVNRSL